MDSLLAIGSRSYYRQYSRSMVGPSPIKRCVAVLCYLAAGILAAETWRDYMLYGEEPFHQPLQRLRLERYQTHLTQAPETLATANVQVVIYLGQRRLVLLQHEQVLNDFPIAVGQADWQTPVGTFKVQSMRADPVWRHPITQEAVGPGPENPLGSHWIGFLEEGEFFIGIHGTNQDDSIGEAVSHGCVRMFNQDIQRLFEQIKIGTPIVVKP
jgi:lipoprotein-anchoring transpeptidase ErfK/SrfK